MTLNQLINPTFSLKTAPYYKNTNKNELDKGTTRMKVYLVIIHVSKSIILINYWCTPDLVIEYSRHTPENWTEYVGIYCPLIFNSLDKVSQRFCKDLYYFFIEMSMFKIFSKTFRFAFKCLSLSHCSLI